MANTAQSKVVLVESPVTVHVKRSNEPGLLPDGEQAWDIESQVMVPGQTINLEELPPYLADSVKKGEVPGLKIMSSAKAKERAEILEEAWENFSPPDAEPAEEDPEFPAEEI